MAKVLTQVEYEKVTPLWDECVVKIEEPPEKLGSIIVPESKRDMDKHGIVAGRLIAKGPMAFVYNINGVPETQDVPIGALVVFKPYAGDLHEAQDLKKAGMPFRIMTSKAIIGVIPEEK
jgi:co-chaperonin GroES (HSP10)